MVSLICSAFHMVMSETIPCECTDWFLPSFRKSYSPLFSLRRIWRLDYMHSAGYFFHVCSFAWYWFRTGKCYFQHGDQALMNRTFWCRRLCFSKVLAFFCQVSIDNVKYFMWKAGIHKVDDADSILERWICWSPSSHHFQQYYPKTINIVRRRCMATTSRVF